MSLSTDGFGPLVVPCGFVFFLLSNRLLRSLVPKSGRTNPQQAWKWTNTANSLLHSFITGIWALLCFYEEPKMAKDLINVYTTSSHVLVSFSVGYFIFDSVDMMLNHRKRSSYELMIHHTCVILCFGLAVVTKVYLGYAVVALLVEVNSVFLHLRQLLIIVGTKKNLSHYRLNSLLNIGTFIVFRIAVLGWMTRWLVINRDHVNLPTFTLGSVGLAIVMVMNIVLFFRICYADFTQKNQKDINKMSESCYQKLQETENNIILNGKPQTHIE
ncbi:unnamed protein product [Meganyctiphanes norvegica]|uniref:TLC domain-containing protein n=1 Tax=Meganyctiphanes norvegica TaxID=48144 RepID=A0AAV2Q515_MEGNR